MDTLIGDDGIAVRHKHKPRYFLALGLFILNIFSTIFAGVLWAGHNPFELTHWHYGVTYSLLLMLF
ncbi:MAG: hypothetical protein J0M05_04615, partial [Candidatus Kapabacteria bacterium]|nr:hypothetical protein [Candidatus Kapabacteria bacterium]